MVTNVDLSDLGGRAVDDDFALRRWRSALGDAERIDPLVGRPTGSERRLVVTTDRLAVGVQDLGVRLHVATDEVDTIDLPGLVERVDRQTSWGTTEPTFTVHDGLHDHVGSGIDTAKQVIERPLQGVGEHIHARDEPDPEHDRQHGSDQPTLTLQQTLQCYPEHDP